jgi:hypothetical protein
MRPTTKTERLAARRIPENSARVALKDGSAVVYLWANTVGQPCAKGYIGSAAKAAFQFTYRDEARRRQHVTAFLAGIAANSQRKAERRAVKSAWTNPLTVGTILYTSWGYDQTNTEFFVVTRVSGRRTWVREIAADFEATGSMTGRTWPAMPIRFIGDETMHTAQPVDGRGVYIKISECRTAWIQTGDVHGVSSYA